MAKDMAATLVEMGMKGLMPHQQRVRKHQKASPTKPEKPRRSPPAMPGAPQRGARSAEKGEAETSIAVAPLPPCETRAGGADGANQ